MTAAAVAKLGHPILPLSGKVPRTAHGVKDATTDPATIKAWGKLSTFGIATVGLAVLDVDGPAGEQALTALEAELGSLPETAEQTTPGGGRHLIFAGDVPSTVAKLGPKLDTRGRGGYIATGAGYKWKRPLSKLTDLPPRWVERLTIPASGESVSGVAQHTKLAELLANPPVKGERNNWLTATLGHFAKAHKHQDAYEQIALGYGREIGLDDAETLKTARSVWGAEEAKSKTPASEQKPGGIANELIELARSTFEIVRSVEGDTFAVRREGSKIALPLRGSGSLRRELTRLYYKKAGKPPNAEALASCLMLLAAEADLYEPQEINIRVAAAPGGVALDLGDVTGRAALIRPNEWEIVENAGVLFRRTKLTAAFPEPVRGGSIDPMRSLLNVTDDDWDLLVGFMVAAWIRGIPHPVLCFEGEQGTAKTTAERYVSSALDPSSAPTRTMPRDIGEWVTTMAGSWVAPLDNLSHVAAWQSDAICRACTGDGLPRRELYSDDDLIVNKLRNVVILTGISLPDLRGDLGDRLLLSILQRITQRRSEKELEEIWSRVRGEVFGGLLDLMADVLTVLPTIDLAAEELPRMADFGEVVAAVDEVRDTDAFDTYIVGRSQISEQVIEGDNVAVALRKLLDRNGKKWTGTATELLKALDQLDGDHRFDRTWPKNPRGLSGHLRRLAPDLHRVGVGINPPTNNKHKTWTVGLI